jgi:serine/threonine protein kinase
LQVPIISKLKHDNVVRLFGHFLEGNVHVLAYEYASMGSLQGILHYSYVMIPLIKIRKAKENAPGSQSGQTHHFSRMEALLMKPTVTSR